MILEIIIGFFVVILSLIIFILSYKKLTKQKLNFNIKKVLLLMGFALLMMANNIFNVNTFKAITSYFIILLLTKIWFKDKNSKIFYYMTIIILLAMIVELLLSKGFSIFFANLDAI